MQGRSISLTKITRPRYTDIYPRKGLFTFLDKARNRPVVWITGPPGYGKSILVSSYMESRKLPCLWYQVDAGDDDIATFFYYMGLAARKAAPHRKKGLPILTPEYLPGLSTFTRRYFEELFSRLKAPACLVLDNYQEAPTDSPFHEVIAQGIEVIPEGIRVIVVSRCEPPAAMSRLRASHSMETLYQKDLTLTHKETLGIMKLRLGRRLSGKTARVVSKELAGDVHLMTHGWAAGLILMLEKIKKGSSPDQIRDMTPETVYDYFTSEIMNKLDDEARVFLLKTSLLPDMDAVMAERLTGLSHGGDILSMLSRNNCFTERRHVRNPVYQFHPLFREYLLSRTQVYFKDDDLSQLKTNAASILQESGMIEDAFELFREAKNYEWAAGLVLAHAPELIAHGRGGVVGQWIAALPDGMVNSSPWLLYWLGVSRIPFNPPDAYSLLERAFGIFRAQRDLTGMLRSWAEITWTLTFASPYVKPLDRWIKVMDELIEEYGELPEDLTGARVSSGMFIALQYRQPDHDDIDHWEKQAAALSEKSGDIHVRVQTLIGQAGIRIQKGDFPELGRVIGSLRRLKSAEDITPLVELTILWMEACYEIISASYEECRRIVSEGLRFSASTGVHVIDFALAGHAVIGSLYANDFTTARITLAEMTESLERVRPFDQCFYHFLRAYYNLLIGDVSQSSSEVDLSVRLAEDVGFLLPESVCNILKAHILHEQNKHSESKRYLNAGRKIADRTKGKNTQFLCLLTEAQFAFDRGDDEGGLKPLRKAMVLGREQGYANNYIWLPDMMENLCIRALGAGIETEYVQWLIKKRGIIPKTPPMEVEEWPWAVKIYTLGRFSLVRDGSPVTFPRKAQQRPLDLLKALISLGGRDIREEQISDTLWPECDGDSAHQAAKTNLHRLRQLLGDENSVSVRDGKVTLNSSVCWVDTWAFERLLNRAERAMRSGDKDQGIACIGKAVALYQGGFLSDSRGEEWGTSYRERLRSKYLRFTGELGRLYEEKADFRKAVETWQKGIESDPAAEEFYQRLMTCYQKLDRRAEAISVYNRLKKVLHGMMGITPSPATEVIYRGLI